jgi:hypothetical protein
MTTISISYIDDSNAASRGYPAETVGWVMEADGQWQADLPRATRIAATDGWPASVVEAKYDAECMSSSGMDWAWGPDSAYDPPRDFTATLS